MREARRGADKMPRMDEHARAEELQKDSVTLLELCSVPALVILYTIWYLLVISANASADPYIFRVISYQCQA